MVLHVDMPPIPDQQSTVICGLTAKYFGLSAIHSWQSNIITATLNKRDSLVIQPTGAGKSLCYIIPPLYDGRTAIIISPTISLMTDQVNKLSSKGISASLLGSAQHEDVTDQLDNYRLIYTTPESFFDKVTKQPRQMFLDMACHNKLSLIAIDEAHLIFSWSSFRYVC
jgi:superfamily II DNA helicase RecQ